MQKNCPRCETTNPPAARFCAHCGLGLEPGIDGSHRPGRIPHARPLSTPEGFEPCRDAADLYFRCESAWGGRVLLDTEGIAVVLFNAGCPLRDLVLRVRGEGADHLELFELEHTVDELPRGKRLKIEVPSWEMSAPLRAVSVALVSAEFGPEN